MQKRIAIVQMAGLLVVLGLLTQWPIRAAAETRQNRDAAELVVRVKNTPLDELKKLTFLELNFMKNAIFASRGYKFADDRPWLNEFFCGKAGKTAKKSTTQALQGMLAAWTAKLKNETGWDLSEYDFPACRDSGSITEEQKRAIANIRIAMFKKIEAYGSIAAIDRALDQEMKAVPTNNTWAWILGKPIQYSSMRALGDVSIRRDVHGLYNVLVLTKRTNSFDAMELLGLFAGDVMFLRNVIEAQQGKPFSGVLAWEISQMIGVTAKKTVYDPEKLPAPVREKLRLLEEVAKKIIASDLNDIPESLKDRAVQFNEPYDFEGC